MTRPSRRTLLRGALLLAALGWVPWALATWLDLDHLGWIVPSAVAFLPYVLVGTLLVLIVAALARAWPAAIVALVGVLLLGVPRIGRLTTDEQPAATGPVITVATSNVYVGHGNVTTLARLLRSGGVDILAVEENTPAWDAAAERAGLRRILPEGFSAPDPQPGAAGLALWSRWPVHPLKLTGDCQRSLGGTVNVPGAAPIHIRATHPTPPFSSQNLPRWQRCTRAFSTASHATGNAILAGDDNATLDHHPIRTLIAHGYRDAAAARGYAWRPTWSNGSWATLAIDHILVTSRIAILGVTAHDLPGSDHDVVVARLRLPRATTP